MTTESSFDLYSPTGVLLSATQWQPTPAALRALTHLRRSLKTSGALPMMSMVLHTRDRDGTMRASAPVPTNDPPEMLGVNFHAFTGPELDEFGEMTGFEVVYAVADAFMDGKRLPPVIVYDDIEASDKRGPERIISDALKRARRGVWESVQQQYPCLLPDRPRGTATHETFTEAFGHQGIRYYESNVIHDTLEAARAVTARLTR